VKYLRSYTLVSFIGVKKIADIQFCSYVRPCLDFDISFTLLSFCFHFHGVFNLY
jgi:hypothetical protein